MDMTEDTKLTITWDNFEKEAPNTFRKLVAEQDFRDVTLVSNDSKCVTAHKVVLSSSSPLFRNILTRNPHQHPFIFLKGVNFLELDLLVRFIYIGECEVAQENLDTFLELGKDLEVNGLTVDEASGPKTQSDIEEHQEHEGVRENLAKDLTKNKFKCPYCEYSYSKEEYVNRHIQTKHTEDKDNIQLKFEVIEDESDHAGTSIDNKTSPQKQIVGEKEEKDKKKTSVEEIFQNLLKEALSTDKKIPEEGQDKDNKGEEDIEVEKTSEETEHGQQVTKGIVTFPCTEDNCSFVSNFKRGLKRHKTWKHKPCKKDGRLVCDIGKCKFKSKLKSGLRRHKTRKHTKQTDIVGDLESKIRKALKVSKNQQHLCDLCEFNAVSLTFLKNHKASIHGMESFSCNQCDFQSGWKSALNTHKTAKHERRKNKCDHCEFSSTYKHILKRHMLKRHSNHTNKDEGSPTKHESNRIIDEPITKTLATDLSLYPQIKCSILNKSDEA